MAQETTQAKLGGKSQDVILTIQLTSKNKKVQKKKKNPLKKTQKAFEMDYLPTHCSFLLLLFFFFLLARAGWGCGSGDMPFITH